MLWPSVHAAAHVYRVRRECGADAYELVWRLIHVSECVAITLAAAAIARIREMPPMQAEYLKLRERSYGLSWNQAEELLEKGQGALDGSIDKWIEMLQLVSGFAPQESGYLSALVSFLNAGAPNEGLGDDAKIDLGPLVRAWAQACDLPPALKGEKVAPKEALTAINSFRNRFAHVPFPYDRVSEVWQSLEECTFHLFAVPPTGSNVLSPLAGAFGLGDSLFRGSGFCKPEPSWKSSAEEAFAWGANFAESWKARPFVHLDKMMRPYVLTRLRNEEGAWEYTRYLAEGNAILRLNEPAWFKILPQPDKNEYASTEEPQPVATGPVAQPPSIQAHPIQDRDQAIQALREKRYEPAIDFFKKELQDRQYYHSGWSRLGYAQREFAAHLMDIRHDEEAKDQLKDSIASYGKAVHHTDSRYSAEAHYHRSKAYWRLWKLTNSQDDLKAALADAVKAAGTYYEDRFLSWSEYVEQETKAPERTKKEYV